MDYHGVLCLTLILHAVSVWSDGEVGLTCPEHQRAFESSCYEFVGLQRNFFSAQAWCERGGGHLAFIQNDETQQFLQKHLKPEQSWWIGLGPSSVNLTLDPAATEGILLGFREKLSLNNSGKSFIHIYVCVCILYVIFKKHIFIILCFYMFNIIL